MKKDIALEEKIRMILTGKKNTRQDTVDNFGDFDNEVDESIAPNDGKKFKGNSDSFQRGLSQGKGGTRVNNLSQAQRLANQRSKDNQFPLNNNKRTKGRVGNVSEDNIPLMHPGQLKGTSDERSRFVNDVIRNKPVGPQDTSNPEDEKISNIIKSPAPIAGQVDSRTNQPLNIQAPDQHLRDNPSQTFLRTQINKDAPKYYGVNPNQYNEAKEQLDELGIGTDKFGGRLGTSYFMQTKIAPGKTGQGMKMAAKRKTEKQKHSATISGKIKEDSGYVPNEGNVAPTSNSPTFSSREDGKMKKKKLKESSGTKDRTEIKNVSRDTKIDREDNPNVGRLKNAYLATNKKSKLTKQSEIAVKIIENEIRKDTINRVLGKKKKQTEVDFNPKLNKPTPDAVHEQMAIPISGSPSMAGPLGIAAMPAIQGAQQDVQRWYKYWTGKDNPSAEEIAAVQAKAQQQGQELPPPKLNDWSGSFSDKEKAAQMDAQQQGATASEIINKNGWSQASGKPSNVTQMSGGAAAPPPSGPDDPNDPDKKPSSFLDDLKKYGGTFAAGKHWVVKPTVATALAAPALVAASHQPFVWGAGNAIVNAADEAEKKWHEGNYREIPSAAWEGLKQGYATGFTDSLRRTGNLIPGTGNSTQDSQQSQNPNRIQSPSWRPNNTNSGN